MQGQLRKRKSKQSKRQSTVTPSVSLRVWTRVRLRISLFSSVGGPLHCILCITNRTNSVNPHDAHCLTMTTVHYLTQTMEQSGNVLGAASRATQRRHMVQHWTVNTLKT